jgi:hypothetical protein
LVEVALVSTSPPTATEVVAENVSPASNSFIVAPALSIRPKRAERRTPVSLGARHGFR